MKTVIVTSENPAKISAVKAAFERAFPDLIFHVKGVFASSGVADQPMSDEETKQGTLNRIQHAKAHHKGDYFVSIEAGFEHGFTFAWIGIENNGQYGQARSASLPLPPKAIEGLMQGRELGDVMDEMFQRQNIKQAGGAIGVLTNHTLTRSAVYEQGIILALIPWIQPELFPTD